MRAILACTTQEAVRIPKRCQSRACGDSARYDGACISRARPPRVILKLVSSAQLFIEAQQLFKRQQFILRAAGGTGELGDAATDAQLVSQAEPSRAVPERERGFGGLSFADLCAIDATAGRDRLAGCERYESRTTAR